MLNAFHLHTGTHQSSGVVARKPGRAALRKNVRSMATRIYCFIAVSLLCEGKPSAFARIHLFMDMSRVLGCNSPGLFPLQMWLFQLHAERNFGPLSICSITIISEQTHQPCLWTANLCTGLEHQCILHRFRMSKAFLLISDKAVCFSNEIK